MEIPVDMSAGDLLFQAVFNQETLGICRIDTISGSIISANKRYREIFGYLPDEAELPTLQEITHPQDLQEYLDNIQLLVSNEIRQFSMEMKCRRSDGSYVPIRQIVSPIRGANEGTPSHLAIIEELSERKPTCSGTGRQDMESNQHERERTGELEPNKDLLLDETNELKKSGHMLLLMKFAMEHMQEAIFLTDEDGRFHFVNAQACRSLGYRREELIAMSVPDIDPDFPPETWVAHWLERKDRKALNFETRHRAKDGLIYPVEVHSINFEFEGREYALALVRDISRRRRAIEALRKAKEELERFFQTSLDLHCIVDNQGRFVRINPQWEKTLGYRQVEMEGRSFLEFVHPDDVAAASEISVEAKQNRVMNFVSRYRARNGTFRWIEWNSNPYDDLIYATARDITERKLAEEERLKMERRLLHGQKLESLGVLAGGIAHDFNNLLMIIIGNLELAGIKLSPDSPERRRIDEATRASQNAATLVRQILTFSGKGQLVLRKSRMGEIISRNRGLFRASVNRNIDLKIDAERELPVVMADHGQIEQVIINLLINASEAIGDKPGLITLKTGVLECSDDFLATSRLEEKPPAGTFVYLEVSDTGCGMDKETCEMMLEPFFTTKFTGRGLGMSVVSGIIRSHHGAIMLESEPKAGSTIRVLFPVALAEENPADEEPWTAPGELPDGGGGTLLVVDDDDDVRNTCMDMVEILGYDASEATNGDEAVRFFREHGSRIDMVILDLTMPVMDGVAAFRELRCIRPDIKVLICTGYDEKSACKRFSDEVPSGFIKKPFSLDALRAKIEQVMKL